MATDYIPSKRLDWNKPLRPLEQLKSELWYLSSPHAERMSEHERLNAFIEVGQMLDTHFKKGSHIESPDAPTGA